MIQEYLSYFFHSLCCPKYVRELGVLHELVAIESRAKRCTKAWHHHRDRTKSMILEQIATLKNRRKVLILGAGLLNDVPLKELAESFSEVVLLDLIFMQSTISETKKYNNVNFVELDVTDSLKHIYYSVQRFRRDQNLLEFAANVELLLEQVPQHYLFDSDLDLVISLNLLSQLPLALGQWLEKQKINYDFAAFKRSLVINHLRYLQQLSANGKFVLLISDTGKEVLSKDGLVLESESSIEGVNIPDYFVSAKSLCDWDWLLAPLGEIDPKYQMQLHVEAYTS